MPKKERFQHAPFGRASSSVLLVKLPVSSWTAAEAANYFLILIFTFVPDETLCEGVLRLSGMIAKIIFPPPRIQELLRQWQNMPDNRQ